MYREVDKEWDVQRAPKGTASSFALTGLVLGLTVDKWWIYANGRSSCVPAAARLARLVRPLPPIASPRCEDAQRDRPRRLCPESLDGPERKCRIETVAPGTRKKKGNNALQRDYKRDNPE